MTGLEVALLVGCVHAIALAIALRSRERNRGANRYLAALLAALALLLFDGFLRARGVLDAHPHLIGMSAWVPFVLGPLFFLYVRALIAPARPPWSHLIVAASYVVLLITTFYPRSASYKLEVAHDGGAWWIRATEVALLIHGLAYALAALALLRRRRGQVEAYFSNLRDVSLRWLIALAILNGLVWVGAIAVFVIRVAVDREAAAASPIVPIGSTLTIFVIGYFQLGQPELRVVEAGPPPAPAPEKPAPAYQRARLPEDDAAELEARIRAAMTERRLYQRSGLTLAELADEVAATPHEISQVLSTRLQRNFYTFVNEHRIEHVKAALLATDRPVLDLAFEAGFQSKSTFNSAFRKATGTTPSDLRARRTG